MKQQQKHETMVAQRVPDGIVGDRLPVVAGQQVLPARVPVGVAHRLGRRSQRTRRVGVLLLRRDVSSVVVGVGDALVLPHAVHSLQLSQAVVGIPHLFRAVFLDLRDVAVRIVFVLILHPVQQTRIVDALP